MPVQAGHEDATCSPSRSCRKLSGSASRFRAPASREFPARTPRVGCWACRRPVRCLTSSHSTNSPRWAEVRLGWNTEGLGITVIADGVSPQQLTERRPEGFAVAQFWVDTRDTRNVSRATRFCHRFVVRIDRGDSRGRLQAQVTQRPVARATADAPISPLR